MDDTYALLTTGNNDYAQRNLTDETLLALGLDMMGFADLSGEIVEAKVLEKTENGSIINAIYRSPAVTAHIHQPLPDKELSSFAGLLKLKDRIWVISLNPVRDSAGNAPAVGWMVWGQALTGRFPSDYNNILAGNNRLADNGSAAGNGFATGEDTVGRIVRTDDKITRYTFLYDLSHRPIVALETTEPRRYYQKGKQVFQYLLWALLAITSFIALLVYLLYRRKIARQFISFERNVSALLGDTAPITTEKDTFTRITEQIEALTSMSSQAERQLKETLSKFDALYHNQHMGMILLEHDQIVDVNQALLNLLGHQRTQLINAPLDILLNNKDGTLSDLNAFQQQDKQDVTHFETNLRSATGQTISCNIEAMRLDNQVSQTVMLAVKDISQQKRQAALIETLSHHDTLSGLLNRPSTTKALNQALTDKRAIITLYVIATRLREIYEIYGHHAYDNAVKHIADMLKQQFPQAEIGRLSENEFIVFTDQIAADQFAPRANTVLKVSANHLSETTADFDIGLNAAMIGPELAFTHFEPLVHCGFYAIEQQSVPKHNVTIVDQETVQAANETLTINRNLVTALKNDEFTAFFQPIVNATSNQVIGFEALARWYHPELGTVSPSIFIPLAEKHKLIVELDELVLEKACAFLQRMQEYWSKKSQHRLTIHVNLSSPHFGTNALINNLQQLIKQYQLSPGQLVLEVTESILLGADQETIERMHALKALGVQLALDDFGTGYSSFSSLCNFPLDIVKLDKSYMSEIETNEKAKTLVRSIINMSQELGMTTVAEGVETASQLRILNVWRVDEIQGFYFFKPMSAEKALSTFGESEQ
ncbi:EAL domain-containing protein [Salinivibrio socompensis]|uniref:bifunctional diguanylate cyclase/phosphodiesterase n=1 Tax=Salinivibrio socompensis TaxID=1510206 RepID=UPI0009DF83D4|nr:EAL domain-containing protein [Salinivibrio socompensis]